MIEAMRAIPAALTAWLGRRHPARFLRFLLVGFITTLLDWVVFYLLAVRLGMFYLAAVSVSITLATFVHYGLNRIFTFRCSARRIFRQMAVHAGLSLTYMLLTIAVMYLLVDLLSYDKMASKMATTALMTLVSYYMSRFITFNENYFQ